MNKLLVTGLAIGNEVGVCESCNFDFDWIINYPNILVWADKILISEKIWEIISDEDCSPLSKISDELPKSLRLVLEIAKSENIIEIIKATDIISTTLSEDIFKEIEKDRELLLKLFPNHIQLGDEKVPGEIIINGIPYCKVHIWTIYASLILAKAFDANFLFRDPVINYCIYKFGLTGIPKELRNNPFNSFQSVFQTYIPNDPIFPHYTFANKEECNACIKLDNCKDGYLSDIENSTKEILNLRNYDEINQLKDVIARITKKREQHGGIILPEEVLNDFKEEQNKIKKRIKGIFPKVKRWSNITTMLSIPIAITGAATQHPLITTSGASIAGISQIANQLVNVLQSKYNWIGFINKGVNLHQNE